jgi:hypothetical protein
MYCKFCNKDFKFQCRLIDHEVSCKLNPNKPEKKKGNQYTKAKELGLPKPKVRQHIWTDEEKKIHSIKTSLINKDYWSNIKNREKHSVLMADVVKNNPESYSSNNVSGRVKMYNTFDFYGETKVKGKWELAVATWLNDNLINWTNRIKPYNYFWNNSWHLYFPDFLLLDNNVIIEVKGYETERDREKWKSVIDKQFFLIKQNEINNLDNIMKQAAVW